MKKEEVLANVICDIQKNFISESFYDDDNHRTHKNVSAIKVIESMSIDYEKIPENGAVTITPEKIKSENLDEDLEGEWSGTLRIYKYDNIEVKVIIMNQFKAYSYCGPFIMFYKIKGE